MIYIFFFCSYLIGSLPFGYWMVKKRTGKDIRELGSKNTGATNVGRVLGKKSGFIILVLDAMKGISPLCFADFFLPGENIVQIQLISGTFAILGHIFSPFLSFRGGKGVATAFGVFLYLATIPCIFSIFLFFIFFKLTGFVSVGSVLGAIALPVIFIGLNWENVIGLKLNEMSIVFVMIVVCIIIIIRHLSNIKRILSGVELKVVD